MKIRDTKPKKSFGRSERKLEFTRILAFSDGVFAIAMTLLVVTIQIPDIPSGLVARELPDAISNLWTSLFSYFLSFAIISLFWIIHYRLSSSLRSLDNLRTELLLGSKSWSPASQVLNPPTDAA